MSPFLKTGIILNICLFQNCPEMNRPCLLVSGFKIARDDCLNNAIGKLSIPVEYLFNRKYYLRNYLVHSRVSIKILKLFFVEGCTLALVGEYWD